MEVSKDFSLLHEDLKEIWIFYQNYKICLNVLGEKDSKIKKKDLLIRKLIIDSENLKLITLLKEYISQDSKIVESVLEMNKENEELNEVFEDFYPPNIIGVSLFER